MKEALKEAQKGEGKVSPNPCVGAVLVKDGEIIVKGYHGEMAALHAERVVLQKIVRTGRDLSLRDCTLYVTLEPCCHYGKTPPCTNAILESGIKTVVIAQTDPNPLVAGQGIQILKSAGIEVIEGVLEKEAQEQIKFFRHCMGKKEPYFLGKLAVSADGYYAIKNEKLKMKNRDQNYFMISSLETKRKTREMRKVFDAILVGKKTLLHDNPHLGVPPISGEMGLGGEFDPLRIIFCQKANFSIKNLQAFRDENVIIACKEKTEVCDFDGKFLFYKDLQDFKQQLFSIGVQSVLVEGGGELLQKFLDEDLIQELMFVESKNVKLGEGKKAPKIPENFRSYKEEDLGGDVLSSFLNFKKG